MAVNTIDEATASSAEYIDDVLAGVRECLVGNLSVLKAGDDSVTTSSIHYGTLARSPEFPSVYVTHLRTRQRDMELGGVRELDMRIRIYAYHKAAAEVETLERDVARLADRIAAVLHANRDRQGEGLWYDLLVEGITTGSIPNDPLVRGAQIDVRARLRVTT